MRLWSVAEDKSQLKRLYFSMHQSRIARLSLLHSLLTIHSSKRPLCFFRHFRPTSIRYYAVSAILSEPRGHGGTVDGAKVAAMKQMLQVLLHVLAKTAI